MGRCSSERFTFLGSCLNPIIRPEIVSSIVSGSIQGRVQEFGWGGGVKYNKRHCKKHHTNVRIYLRRGVLRNRVWGGGKSNTYT